MVSEGGTQHLVARRRQSHHGLPQCGVEGTSQTRDLDEQLKFEGCSQCGEWSHQKKVHSYGLHHGAAHSLHQALATILNFLGGRNRLSQLGVITSMHKILKLNILIAEAPFWLIGFRNVGMSPAPNSPERSAAVRRELNNPIPLDVNCRSLQMKRRFFCDSKLNFFMFHVLLRNLMVQCLRSSILQSASTTSTYVGAASTVLI